MKSLPAKLRAIGARLSGLFRRRSLDAEMNDELRAHLDALIDRNLAAGMSPDEARTAAQRAFGGVAQIQERARDERRSAWGEHVLQDLHYALRQARKHPGFAATVVLILGLGIGATTVVFSALDVLLLRNLPVSNPEELVVVTHLRTQAQGNVAATPYVSPGLFAHLSEQGRSFAGVLALNGSGGMRTLVAPGGESVRVRTNDVSGSYFSVLQVQPRLGRLIAADDDRKGAARAVAVLSHAFWRQHFGGDPRAIGKSVLIEKVAFEIIGVAAEGFGGVEAGDPIAVWTPLGMLPALNPRLGENLSRPDWAGLHILARLRPGVAAETAGGEADLIYQRLMLTVRPEVSAGDRARVFGRMTVEPGARGYGGKTRAEGGPILGILLAVTVLVQLIACANVASLLLARLATRRRELAARAALGASRGRIARQLLTEALVLVAGGAAVGGLLVQWGFWAARARGIEAQPGGWIALFVSALTGAAVALVPALCSSRVDLVTELKRQGGAVAAGRSRLQATLVVLQLAVCGCLLAGTGYFVRTLQALRNVDLGFAARNVLTMAVDTPGDYTPARRTALTRELLERIGGLAGVAHVTTSTTGLMSGGAAQGAITVDGYAPQRGEDMTVSFVFSGPDIFETLGLPLVRGRGLTFGDVFPATKPAAGKAVINEAVVRRFFGDSDPLGRRFRWGKSDYEIVGVVRNSKYRSLREENPLICYIPQPETGVTRLGLQVRAAGEPRGLAAAVAAVVREVDPNARVLYTQTVDDVMRQATMDERTTALGVAGFSALALLLTSLGLYGLLACNVAQRTREIGVRVALGGRPGDIVALIVKQGLVLTIAGWMLGTMAAMGLVRFVASRLYGVSGADPVVLLTSGIVLATVATLACWLPARRATRVDPMVALRTE